MKHIAIFWLALLICFSATASTYSFNPKVTLAGKVFCNKSKKPIASSITLIAEGTNPIFLSVSTDGSFTALLPDVDQVKILAKADGYDAHEQNYSIPNIQQDTTLYVEIFLSPQYFMMLEGRVLDAKTNLPIEAELDLFYDSDILKEDIQVIHDGKYKEEVSKPGWYLIDILSPGYLSVTDSVWLVHEGTRMVKKDYHLTPIEVGLNVVIENVYFYFGQTELKPESSGSLDKIIALLKNNPTLELEISGHTDDEGDADYNLALSQGRAEAIVKYFVSVGIAPARLTAHGYGETKPIDLAKTKAAKSRNRRVEFTIVKK